MKIKNIVLITASFFVLLSCSKDIDNENSVAELIGTVEGNWQVTAYSFEGSRQTILFEDISRYEFEGRGWELHVQFNFTENPNTYNVSGFLNIDHSVTYEDGDHHDYVDTFTWTESGTWNRNNRVIHLETNSIFKTADIILLDDLNMSLDIRTSTSENTQDGASITTINNEHIEFIKVN